MLSSFDASCEALKPEPSPRDSSECKWCTSRGRAGAQRTCAKERWKGGRPGPSWGLADAADPHVVERSGTAGWPPGGPGGFPLPPFPLRFASPRRAGWGARGGGRRGGMISCTVDGAGPGPREAAQE
eukprot:8512183-Pyramimonas_sp.AAC.1